MCYRNGGWSGFVKKTTCAEAEAARTELAKALLRLEALPCLEKEADQLREDLRMETDRRIFYFRSNQPGIRTGQRVDS